MAFFYFLNSDKIYIAKFTILTILSIQFSDIKYIDIVVQCHHLSTQLFHLPELKRYTH